MGGMEGMRLQFPHPAARLKMQANPRSSIVVAPCSFLQEVALAQALEPASMLQEDAGPDARRALQPHLATVGWQSQYTHRIKPMPATATRSDCVMRFMSSISTAEALR